MPTARTPKKPVEVAEESVQETTKEVKPVDTRKIQIVSDGSVIDVEVIEKDGRNVVKESVWKEVPLPFTNRTTRILVAAAGTTIG